MILPERKRCTGSPWPFSKSWVDLDGVAQVQHNLGIIEKRKGPF